MPLSVPFFNNTIAYRVWEGVGRGGERGRGTGKHLTRGSYGRVVRASFEMRFKNEIEQIEGEERESHLYQISCH